MTDKVELGDTARDTITGFTGVVTSKHEYLNGCVRFGLQPKDLDKDGKIIQAEVIDDQQVELVVKRGQVAQPATKPPGGPNNEPPRQAVPAARRT